MSPKSIDPGNLTQICLQFGYLKHEQTKNEGNNGQWRKSVVNMGSRSFRSSHQTVSCASKN